MRSGWSFSRPRLEPMNTASTTPRLGKFSCGRSVTTAIDRFSTPSPRTPSLPGARPRSRRSRCGGRKSKFLAVNASCSDHPTKPPQPRRDPAALHVALRPDAPYTLRYGRSLCSASAGTRLKPVPPQPRASPQSRPCPPFDPDLRPESTSQDEQTHARGTLRRLQIDSTRFRMA
jgi:hypothetical protein